MTKKLAVLISNSGLGTNLQAIIDAIEKNVLHAAIIIVVSDSNDAYGLTRARKHHIPTHILSKNENITILLTQIYSVDYIVLAGWKKIIPNNLIDIFPNKIVNIHPGLIPDTIDGVVKNPDGSNALWNRGKFTTKALEQFLAEKATYAGSTVHFLSKQFDFGPVLARGFEKTRPDDTVDTLYDRLKKREHELLLAALTKLCN